MSERKAAQAEENKERAEKASVQADEAATQAGSETRTRGGKRRLVPLAVVGPTLPFDYLGRSVTTVCSDLTGWFVLPEIAAVIGLKNPTVAIKSLDDDEKGIATIPTAGGPQEVNVISESGLYTLITRSNKPEAKAFRRWVMGEVLPTLRRTGRYEMPGQPKAPSMSHIEEAAKTLGNDGTYVVQVWLDGSRHIRKLDYDAYVSSWSATDGLQLAQSIQMIETAWTLLQECEATLDETRDSFQHQELGQGIATSARLAKRYIEFFRDEMARLRGEPTRGSVN